MILAQNPFTYNDKKFKREFKKAKIKLRDYKNFVQISDLEFYRYITIKYLFINGKIKEVKHIQFSGDTVFFIYTKRHHQFFRYDKFKRKLNLLRILK